MMWGRLSLASIAASLLTQATPLVAADATKQEREVVYVDAARTHRVVVSDRLWTDGPIVEDARQEAQYEKSGLLIEEVGQPVVDCSDRTLRCIRSWSRVLAVPVDGLRNKLTYEKDGVRFAVEECIQGDGKQCWAALVSAKCKSREDDDAVCRSDGSGRTDVFEYIVYFIYNDRHGITAMGFADREQKSAAEMNAVATQLILVGDLGLLRKP